VAGSVSAWADLPIRGDNIFSISRGEEGDGILGGAQQGRATKGGKRRLVDDDRWHGGRYAARRVAAWQAVTPRARCLLQASLPIYIELSLLLYLNSVTAHCRLLLPAVSLPCRPVNVALG